MSRIALIHALSESIAPIHAAFEALWPEASRIDLLDDSLSRDRALANTLTPNIVERFIALGREARAADADAILFTCSAFGPAIEAVAADLAPLPVHKPNSAMIRQAVAHGGRIGLLASYAPTLQAMVAEFPSTAVVQTGLCDDAMAALVAGDGQRHDRLAAEAAQRQFVDCDVIALAQFSLARAAPAVASVTGKTVLTTPDSAVAAVRRSLEA